jgi:hypothetical protein
MIGAFLVLHALLHLALALTLPTATYLVAGRAVNWAATGAGALCLYSYLHRAGTRPPRHPARSDRAAHPGCCEVFTRRTAPASITAPISTRAQ